MRLQFYLLILTFLLFATPLTAQKKMQTSDVPTIDFCELINQSSKYDQKIVRTKAIYVSGYHGSMVSDYECDSGDASMEAGYEKSKVFKTKKNVRKRHDEIFKATRENLYPKAQATMIGRFHDWNGYGYGHLGWARFQFDVMSFENVEPFDDSIPRKKSMESEFMAEVENLRNLDSVWSSVYSGNFEKDSDDVFAPEYIFEDLQGGQFNREQFRKKNLDPKIGSRAVHRGGKVFIEGKRAFIKQAARVDFVCPNAIFSQFQYDNEYEKQEGVWKLVRTKITSDKAPIEKYCY